jgi:glycosyltransferase involved in cell wall biosynthesis
MKKKLMIFNIFFAPKSFGGATIVAEEIAKRLKNDFEILVVTSISHEYMPKYNSFRYKAKGLDIVGINLPDNPIKIDTYMNPYFTQEVSKWIEVFKPDIAHIHCIQNMGADFINILEYKNIPFVITVHDNWWICEKQFMINNFGKYCWQEKIDYNLCKECVSNVADEISIYHNTEYRANYLKKHLCKANKILFPSEFQKNLYKVNLSHHCRNKLLVNKNGIKFPSKDFKKVRNEKITFAFVGGIGPIKGLDLIIKAFEEINSSNYILKIVDNTLNLGFSSVKINSKKLKGDIRIVPAYTQDTIDEFFSDVDVLLFPSQWKESFGLTVREALVRDCFIIATDSGGVVEDIIPNKNGIILPLDGDYKKLKEAIENVLQKDFTTYKNINTKDIFDFDKQSMQLKEILFNVIKKNINAN